MGALHPLRRLGRDLIAAVDRAGDHSGREPSPFRNSLDIHRIARIFLGERELVEAERIQPHRPACRNDY